MSKPKQEAQPSQGHLGGYALLGMAILALAFHLVLDRVDMASFERVRSFVFRAPQLFMNGTHDDHFVAVTEIEESRTAGPRIFLIGTSAIRESIDPDVLAERLTQAGVIQDERQLVPLTVSGLRLMDALYLVHLAQPRAGDRFYLFTSPIMLSQKINRSVKVMMKERRYFLGTSTFKNEFLPHYAPVVANQRDLEIKEKTMTPGLLLRRWIVNQERGWAARAVYRKAVPWYDRYKTDDFKWTREEDQVWLRITDKKMRGMSKRNPQVASINAALLDAFVAYSKEREARFEILKTPATRSIVRNMYGQRWTSYFDELKEKHGAAVCCTDLNNKANLVDEDFFDPVHVREAGRKKWTDAFATYLLGQVQQESK